MRRPLLLASLAAAAAVAGLGACRLDAKVLYRCDAQGSCARPGYTCWADGFCHPPEDADGGVLYCDAPDASACPLEVECGYWDAGCGVWLDCRRTCTAPMECGAKEPNRCGYPSLCNGEGWCWENPLPQGNTLRAAHAVHARAAWYVGEAATIVFYDGEHHLLQDAPAAAAGADLLAVHGASATEVFAVGTRGTILHFDGQAWEPEGITTGITTTLRGVWTAGGGLAFAVGDSGKVLYRRPAAAAGARWAEATLAGAATPAFTAVWGLSAQQVFAMASNGDVWTLNPATSSFSIEARLNSFSLVTTLSGVGGELLTAVGQTDAGGGNTVILRRDADGGWGWLSVVPMEVRQLRGSSVDDLFALGPSYLRHLEDGGWVRYGPNQAAHNGVAVLGPSRAVLVGDGGSTVACCESGYRELSGGSFRSLNALCGTQPDFVFAVGDSNQCSGNCSVRVHERAVTPVGVRWTFQETRLGNTQQLLGCFAESAERVWAYGNDSKFVRRMGGQYVYGDFGGNNWGAYGGGWGPKDGPWYFTNDRDFMVVTYDGGLAEQAFVQIPLTGAPNLSSVWGVSRDDAVAVGDGVVVTLRDGGWSQTAGPAARQMSAVHGQALPAGATYVAVGAGGEVWRREGAAPFSTAASPTTEALRGVWLTPRGQAWTAGGNETAPGSGRYNALVFSQAPGAGWVPSRAPSQWRLNALWGVTTDAGSAVFVGGANGTILRRDVP